MKKRLICALCTIIAICIIAGTGAAATAAVSTSDSLSTVLFGRSTLLQMPNGESLAFAYDKLSECALSHSPSTPVKDAGHSISPGDVSSVYKMFIADHPECFWVQSISYSIVQNTVTSIMPVYSYTSDEAAAAAAAMSKAADEMCRGLIGLDDYEVSLALHDRLSDAVDYVFGENDQTAYGALVEGRAVCAGYSAAYQYLMNRMGITAFTVTGTSADPTSGESVGHAWNLVMLDGEWYLTDVTWDDQSESGSEMIFHEFLNGTTEQFDLSHTPDKEIAPYLPVCTADADNYFVRNNTAVTKYSEALTAFYMAENGFAADFFVDGDAEKFISDFYSGIRSLASRLGISGGFSYGYSVLRQEVVLRIYTDSVPKVCNFSVGVESSGSSTAPTSATLSIDGVALRTVRECGNNAVCSFEGILPGNYTLTLEKENHLSRTFDISVSADSSFSAVLYSFGDLTMDNSLNFADSYGMKKILIGSFAFTDSELQMQLADINRDGTVNLMDQFILKRYMLSGAA